MRFHYLLPVILILFVATTAVAAPLDPAHDLTILTRLLDRSAGYDYGQSRASLNEIERLLPRFYGGSQQREAEDKLIAALSNASPGMAEFICRQLSRFASDASIEPLIAQLSRPQVAGIAIYALGAVPGDTVARRMREIYEKVGDKEKAGIVWILGEKKDAASLPLLAGLLTGANSDLATSAAVALGKLGSPEALQALGAARAKTTGDIRLKIMEAELACAENMAGSGRAADARALYTAMRDANVDPQYRAAALHQLVLADPANAAKNILAALSSGNEPLVAMAASLADRVKDDTAVQQMTATLPSLSIPSRIRLLGAFERSGNRITLPTVVKAMADANDGVKVAALHALDILGDATAVDAVSAAAARPSEFVQPVARKTLDTMPGVGVDARIVQLLATAAPPVQAELARSAAVRTIADALPALRTAAAGTTADLRIAAIRSLGIIGLPEDQATLVRMLAASPDRELENATVAISARTKDVRPVLGALESARDIKAKAALLSVLGRLGNPAGLDAIQQALAVADLKTAAVTALAQWPSPLPMRQLYDIAVMDDDLARHTAALSGFIRMATREGNLSISARVELLSDAITVGRRVEERRQAVAALGDLPSIEAMRLAVAYATVEELRPTARAAVTAISQKYAGPNDQHVVSALQSVSDEASPAR